MTGRLLLETANALLGILSAVAAALALVPGVCWALDQSIAVTDVEPIVLSLSLLAAAIMAWRIRLFLTQR